MKILLLGEYSNVHCALGKALSRLGHDVTVASDGDGWKNYPRDVNLLRGSNSIFPSLAYLYRLRQAFRTFRGYDVVQIINPVFLSLRAERIWTYYDYLKKHNGSVFLGAFGMDHYYVRAGLDCKTFRYSDFNLGPNVRVRPDNDIWIRDWLNGEKGRLNRYIADDCDGIIAGLYEYYVSYAPDFQEKTVFIPFPIDLSSAIFRQRGNDDKLSFFIGIQRSRSEYKGTDIMLRALRRVVEKYPHDCSLVQVESVPFAQYRQLLQGSDVLLDQLYSYTPAMNALEAMAQGMVVVGGGEPENYRILDENELRPIVNVCPDEEDVYRNLCQLVECREALPSLSSDSRSYIERHHDSLKVARRYLDFWQSRL